MRLFTQGARIGLLAALLACQQAPEAVWVAEPGERLVLDTRPPEEFAAGHVAGALNLQWGYRQLATQLGRYVPDRATPLALRASDGREAREALALCVERGYRDVVLWEGGNAERPGAILRAAELARLLEEPDPPTVIDVRTAAEFREGVIPGALLVREEEAPGAVAALDRQASYAVVCAVGWRSAQLASWMRREGFRDVRNVIDGMRAWEALPEREGAPPANGRRP